MAGAYLDDVTSASSALGADHRRTLEDNRVTTREVDVATGAAKEDGNQLSRMRMRCGARPDKTDNL